MMAMAMLSIAIAVIFYAFTASMRVFTGELSDADASMEMHRAIERMTNELRGSLEIISANGTGITFWYDDLNNDGTREANETAQYSWTGTSEGYINRTVQTSTQEIANGVKSFSLTYNDPSPSNIRVVNIYITVQKDSTVSTLESGVKLRNL